MSAQQSVLLHITVWNKPGVLFRVISHFRRLNINIERISVTSSDGSKSRITIDFSAGGAELELLKRLLSKSIDVLEVGVVNHIGTLKRELLLAQLKSNHAANTQDIVLKHDARILARSEDSLVVELTGDPQTINSFIKSASDLMVSYSRTGLAVLQVEEGVEKDVKNIL